MENLLKLKLQALSSFLFIIFFNLQLSVFSQTIAIPDANFEQALIDLGIDTNGLNGNILETDALAVTQLYVNDPLTNPNLPNVNALITDLTGIEGFTNLTRLRVHGNNLSSIDVSQNVALEWLFANNNQLSSINLINNTSLSQLNLDNNNFSSIDISNYTTLTIFRIGGNNLSSLDVSNNLNLERLFVSNNQLTAINVDVNTSLTWLDLVNNQISTIDVTNNTALEVLYLENNLLTSVDVSQNTSLLNLAVGLNPITSLDISMLPQLPILTTEGTLISSLDLSQNINLEQLWIADNPNLTSIDLSNNPLLFNLGIYNVPITDLDLSNNAITSFYAGDNLSLSFLDFRNGNNVNVTVFEVPNTPNLTCINTDATTSQEMINSGKTLSTDCGSVPSSERNALIALYNSAGGANWANNTNWNTTQPVSTWAGVTVVNGHVTRIEKNRGNLVGTLPAELQNLTYLEHLQLSRNYLSGTVPDLTGLANLNFFNINLNNFQFADFENEYASYNANIAFFGAGVMNKVELESDVDLVVGQTYAMNMPVIHGTGVTYQWYKNNEPLVGETGLTYTITNAQVGDAGNYTCKASSPIVTDLSIERETVHIYREILALDRDALIAIYNATNGSSWTTNTNWNSAAPVYQWHGVTMNDNRVIEINLESNNLVGTLPVEIGDLDNLEKLVLNFNNLTGNIPVEIGNCTSLTEINFWGNNFSGNIPSELGNCTSLVVLSLEDNQLTGNIPMSFSNLTAMGSFWVNGNQLSGDIPNIFSNWPDLFYFSIGDVNGTGSSNNFTGTVDLSSNSALIGCWVDNNALSALNIQNGNNVNFNANNFNAINNPNLECIQVDDAAFSTTNWTNLDVQTSFNENCASIWTVYTPDTNLNTAIATSSNFNQIDTSGDGEITLEEAAAYTGTLDLSNSSITDITGLEAFTSVTEINLSGNSITDISSLIYGVVVTLTRNGLAFKTVERRAFNSLQILNCSNNNLKSLDVSIITTLTTLDCSNNQLEVLNVKNGNNISLVNFDASGNPGLYCVLVDDVAYATAHWTAKDNQTLYSDTDCYAKLQPNVFLQGAMLNPIPGEEALMRDSLRSLGYLPTTSPYTDALTCDVSVFNTTGNDAIVDWVEISLRDALNPGNKLQTRSALLQRDGDVVDVDGVSEIVFDLWAKSYYVSINHRNHLSVMSNASSILNFTPSAFNFADGSISTYGTNAQVVLGSGKTALWAGDVNGNGQVRYLGPGNDTNTIKDIVLNPINGNPSGSNFYPFSGYNNADINLNGIIRYLGPNNDTSILKDIILGHPVNGSLSNFFPFISQTPN